MGATIAAHAGASPYPVGVKYAVIIMDGAADAPLPELGGLTPLERAATPNLDRVAMMGRLGRVRTVAEDAERSDAASLVCLLGYDGARSESSLQRFEERFGVRGVLVSHSERAGGVAGRIGWERVNCKPEVSSVAKAAVRATGSADLVCCHLAETGEASRRADVEGKIAAIEAIDADLIGPVLEGLREFGDPESDPQAKGWRLLVAPSHVNLVSTGQDDPAPVPFAMAGAWVRSMVKRPFGEANAAEADLQIERGHELMEYFLKGGLASVRTGLTEVKRAPGVPKKAPGKLRRQR